MITAPDSFEQPEAVLLRVRRHGRRLVLPVLVLIACAGAAGFFIGRFDEAWMNLAVGFGLLAAAVLLGVLPLLSWLSTRVIVTTRRVIVRHGLLVQRRTEVPLGRVREIRTRRGPLQRMSASGDVELLVGPDEPTVLRDLPGVRGIVEALHELVARNYTGGFPGPAGPLVPGARRA